MYKIIDLLNDKNFCLEKFYRINETELNNFKIGQFDHLERFYKNREGLLNIIKKIDEIVEERSFTGEDLDFIENDSEMKKQIAQAFEYKNEIVNKILAQDLEILSAIESAKSQIIKELTQVRTAKKAIGSYKSGQTTNNLDEEI